MVVQLAVSQDIPPENTVRDKIGYLMRELEIARRLLKLSRLADEQRQKAGPNRVAHLSVDPRELTSAQK